MSESIRKLWLKISLKKKIGFFAAMVILVMAFSVAFNISIMNFSLNSFDEILKDNARCHDFQEAIELEAKAFEAYIRERTEENRETYLVACVRTERCIRFLPYDYERIGMERYARTWNVRNGYEGYSIYRDEAVKMDQDDPEFVKKLYDVYEMQSYLQTYARRLVQVTLRDGTASYEEKVPVFYNIPYLILFASIGVTLVILFLTKVLSSAFINPLLSLARNARKIAGNDFTDPDIKVPNQDEMGELVAAFNKMKHATRDYINTLQEKNEMAVLLHKEELLKVEMEKRLDIARLELLKSQINPHFLFNTLNMISCMAKLEDANTTEQMITSLSSLFRYNLKTSAQTVPLEQEMKVVKDYMYIQQMRFGSRIRYTTDVQVDASQVIIPAFTLQPVVENAIIHGLSKKEQGGKVHLRVWRKKGAVVISIADTGLGMNEEQRDALEQGLKAGRTANVGIGLGNIYKRIHAMYQEGDMAVYSFKGRGTAVQLVIPQEEWKQEEGQD